AARKLCRDGGDADAKIVAAVERLARSDRRLAATVEQWDANHWLLATPGGTVDLRTGEMQPARREDYCTKQTPVAPAPRIADGGASPDLWLKFLDRVFNKNDDLIAFVQRLAGYCLTGDIREHVFPFLWGSGRPPLAPALATHKKRTPPPGPQKVNSVVRSMGSMRMSSQMSQTRYENAVRLALISLLGLRHSCCAGSPGKHRARRRRPRAHPA